jgi:hypothetical protein
VGPSNCGEGKYDGRTSDVTDVTTDIIAGEFRAEGGATGNGGRTFLWREAEAAKDSERQREPVPSPSVLVLVLLLLLVLVPRRRV